MKRAARLLTALGNCWLDDSSRSMKFKFSHLSAKTDVNYQGSELNTGLALKQRHKPIRHSVVMILDGLIMKWL